MKTRFFLPAIAIVMAGLVSCNKEKEAVNPEYNAQTDEVNANFVFNVATSTSPATKMTAEDTQAEVTDAAGFRGIDNAQLLAFKLDEDGKHIVTETTPEKDFDLGLILAPGALDVSGAGTDRSRRILELSIPAGTNAFLFYGKAIKSGTDDEQGVIDYNVDASDVSASSFALKVRLDREKEVTVGNNSGTLGDQFDQNEKLITSILTRILKNGFNGTTTYNYVQQSTEFGGVNISPAIDWKDYASLKDDGKTYEVAKYSPYTGEDGTETTVAITPLEEILGDAFATFVNIKDGELRAGSGKSISRMIYDLSVVIKKVQDATPTSMREAVAQTMAKRILTRFGNYFNMNEDEDKFDWLAANVVIDDLVNNAKNPSDNSAIYETSEFNLVTTGDLQTFPTNFDVPMGSALLLINPADLTVSYNSNDLPTYAMGDASFNVYKYTYPAELCYFGNSPIRVSAEAHEKADYPDGVLVDNALVWDNDDEWTEDWTKDAHVLSSTRSVAMQENINYGSALLKATVGYATGVTALEDNNSAINPGEEPNTFEPTAGQFLVTGLLIGGQYQTMGWNFVKTAASEKDFILYDKIADITDQKNLPGAISIPATGSSDANYTLVWDNYNGVEGDQDAVYVAVELVNKTGKDFWGKHNVIRKDGTFYIIGKLTPSANKNTGFLWPYVEGDRATNPNYIYALPPYKADGSTLRAERIFIQDYVTIANFKLGKDSLKQAFVTVPDLRSTQMSLGLSVDLSWQEGMSFEVVLGE